MARHPIVSHVLVSVSKEPNILRFTVDEFELECVTMLSAILDVTLIFLIVFRLLGENWAYVTIVLIGQENCPHHHRHANELERISKANEHIQSYDCHGRICERLVVHDVLQRVYAENAPKREEIMDPQYVSSARPLEIPCSKF